MCMAGLFGFDVWDGILLGGGIFSRVVRNCSPMIALFYTLA